MIPGISVILPSYNNRQTLVDALYSLNAQTLDPSLFEVIVVLNGESELSRERIAEFKAHSSLELRVFTSSHPGAGRARNLGLSLVRRSHVTFLDDDDLLEPSYLETAWALVTPDTAVLLGITDMDASEHRVPSTLATRIDALRGATVPVTAIPWALGFNACKVIPAALLTRYRFDEELRSGEDVAFFAQLLAHPSLAFHVVHHAENSSYVRRILTNSVSRKSESYNFNVVQRIDVIAALKALTLPSASQPALRFLVSAQRAFVTDFLTRHPGDVNRAINYAVQSNAPGLKLGELRPETVTRAVFSYCFPPYADTAGNVAAKRVRAAGELVDVYSATMDRVRPVDESSMLMVDQFVRYHDIIPVVASFADWQAISIFAQRTYGRAKKRSSAQGGYASLYSRSMWSGSHVAALLYKDDFPGVSWTAEFSDPLCLDVTGAPRPGKLTSGRVTSRLKKMAQRSRVALPFNPDGAPQRSHFALTEALTMAYADTLVFTNANQRDLMLSYYPVAAREQLRAKSVVESQKQPDPKLYHLVESTYERNLTKVNIGYFGSFYPTRGIGDVVTALATLPPAAADKFQLHIFTPYPDKARAALLQHNPTYAVHVRINHTVPYLEFLNLSTRFDVLVVSDTDITGTQLPLNPFLPSKYADYAGSGTPVWGITTAGSPLSQCALDYQSESGTPESSLCVLLELVSQ